MCSGTAETDFAHQLSGLSDCMQIVSFDPRGCASTPAVGLAKTSLNCCAAPAVLLIRRGRHDPYTRPLQVWKVAPSSARFPTKLLSARC